MNRPSIALSRITPALFAVLTSAPAFAAAGSATADTWKWRDASGQFVYSDLPPSPGTAFTGLTGLNHGVRIEFAAEAGREQPLERSSPVSAESDAAPVPPATGNGWAEREKASRQRATERMQAEQREIDEKREAASATRACEDAAANLRMLVRGVRVATVNARGETEVMVHAERTRRIDSIHQTLARHCGAHD